jgi:hypothetical protein
VRHGSSPDRATRPALFLYDNRLSKYGRRRTATHSCAAIEPSGDERSTLQPKRQHQWIAFWRNELKVWGTAIQALNIKLD